MKQHFVLNVELTLLGPILTRGGQLAEPGIDAPMARDAFGRFMIPYSLVKGKVLDAFRELRPKAFQNYSHSRTGNPKYRIVDAELGEWLGKEPEEGELAPERGRVRFGDFVTEQKGTVTPGHDGIIERIQIDQETGATAGRMLAMIEAPFGYGEPVKFEGKIEFISEADEANRIQMALEEALKAVPAFGAMRTVGFGRTQSVSTKLISVKANSKSQPTNKETLPIRFRSDRPLCLVGAKHSRNHFESLQNIGGAVLKGATARLVLELNGLTNGVIESGKNYSQFPYLCKYFETIRFAEARPQFEKSNSRPVIPPLSLVISPVEELKGQWFDVALEPISRLIGGAAPIFSIDWKDGTPIDTAFAVVKLPSERRTRTAIEAGKGRAAEEQLFSYGLVLPKTPDQEFVWEGSIGLENVPEPDRRLVLSELQKLFEFGLPNIGKTRAVAEVEWLSHETAAAFGSNPVSEGLHVITLQTDCLMTNPESLKLGTDLKAVYQDFWDDIAPEQFQLVGFFARQSLHGGFLAKRSNGSKYEPFLLTDRGSTFVLQASDESKAKPFLETWTKYGLPNAKWIAKRYGEPLWKTCPFLNEVGFGEVLIDLECHTNNRPPEEKS